MLYVIIMLKKLGSAASSFLLFCLPHIGCTQQATCPTSEQRDLAKQVVTASFNDFTVITNHPCGFCNWTRIVNLNISDPKQLCPPGTGLSLFTPIRVCGIDSDIATCSSTMFDV